MQPMRLLIDPMPTARHRPDLSQQMSYVSQSAAPAALAQRQRRLLARQSQRALRAAEQQASSQGPPPHATRTAQS